MSKIGVVMVTLSLLATSGCVVRVGTAGGTAITSVSGLASAYVSVESLPPYEATHGTIVRAGLFDMGERPGEIASVDVWPLAGAAVGVIGARVRILMLEAGAGALWYQPQPPIWPVPPTTDP